MQDDFYFDFWQALVVEYTLLNTVKMNLKENLFRLKPLFNPDSLLGRVIGSMLVSDTFQTFI